MAQLAVEIDDIFLSSLEIISRYSHMTTEAVLTSMLEQTIMITHIKLENMHKEYENTLFGHRSSQNKHEK